MTPSTVDPRSTPGGSAAWAKKEFLDLGIIATLGGSLLLLDEHDPRLGTARFFACLILAFLPEHAGRLATPRNRAAGLLLLFVAIDLLRQPADFIWVAVVGAVVALLAALAGRATHS